MISVAVSWNGFRNSNRSVTVLQGLEELLWWVGLTWGLFFSDGKQVQSESSVIDPCGIFQLAGQGIAETQVAS